MEEAEIGARSAVLVRQALRCGKWLRPGDAEAGVRAAQTLRRERGRVTSADLPSLDLRQLYLVRTALRMHSAVTRTDHTALLSLIHRLSMQAAGERRDHRSWIRPIGSVDRAEADRIAANDYR